MVVTVAVVPVRVSMVKVTHLDRVRGIDRVRGRVRDKGEGEGVDLTVLTVHPDRIWVDVIGTCQAHMAEVKDLCHPHFNLNLTILTLIRIEEWIETEIHMINHHPLVDVVILHE